MPDEVSPNFAARAIAMLRAAVSEYGTITKAADKLGIPRTTASDIVNGNVSYLRDFTIQKIGGAYQTLSHSEQWHLQAGADLFSPLPTNIAIDTMHLALENRQPYHDTVQAIMVNWVDEKERLKEQGAPPLESNSP